MSQIQCRTRSFPYIFPSLCSLCYIKTSPTQTRLLIPFIPHAFVSSEPWWEKPYSAAALPPGDQDGEDSSAGVTRLSWCPCETLWSGCKVMGRDRAVSTNETAQVKKNIKMTWSWLPMTHCTIHFWKQSIFTWQDDPWKARLRLLQLPPTLATHVKLTRKGELFHHQEGTRRVRTAYILQHFCFYTFSSQLWVWRQQRSQLGFMCAH